MDFIRFPYASYMRFAKGGGVSPVRWYAVTKNAPDKPEGYGYGSKIWEDHWRDEIDSGRLGEVPGIKPKWLPHAAPVDPQCGKGPYWPTRYRPGVPETDLGSYVALDTDGQGNVIACCGPVVTTPQFALCDASPVIRLPQSCFLKFSPSAYPSCWLETTVVPFNRNAVTGIWSGAADPGIHGLPMEVVYNPNASAFDKCAITITLHYPSIPAGTLRLAIAPGVPLAFPYVTYSVAPGYMRWEWNAGPTASLLYCDFVGSGNAANTKVELLTYS